MKTYVYRRLWEVLSGKEQAKPYDRLDAASRQAILEILLQTKTDLPDYWKKGKRQALRRYSPPPPPPRPLLEATMTTTTPATEVAD